MNKYEIIELLDRSDGWGKACNQIQDAAFEVLTDSEWDAFAIRQERDYQNCEGSDYLIMNGQYFDWRQFKTKETDIILAYLSYFTEPQLEKILKYLKKGGE